MAIKDRHLVRGLLVVLCAASMTCAYAANGQEPAPAPPAPLPPPAGAGVVFGSAPDGSGEDLRDYTPDWSRFSKTGLFSSPATSAPSADETVDVQTAENHYIELLNMELPEVQRIKTLLELAQIYHRYNIKPKEAAVYERFVETYPQNPMTAEIYMRLGFLYRDMGSFSMALAKFYSVLNASLAVNRAGMDAYKQLSLRARAEIADTYYVMGDYEQAATFYMRLKRLDMSADDRVIVDFKYAYTQYLLKNYPTTISSFQAFIRSYPQHPLVAEAHFVLANAFKQVSQPRAALEEVLSLLRYQQQQGEDSETWDYWKRRTGNHLGNEFYEQGDYESALSIYQAMAILSDEPAWRWPVVYQMGLCFERLRLTSKALSAYNVIIEGAHQLSASGVEISSSLNDVVEQAKWRVAHLQWEEDTQRQIQQILGE